MNIINLCAKFFLLFGQQAAYLPIIVIGAAFYKKSQIFWHAFILLFFSMIFSTTLKHIFQVPLNPALGIEGYAFPSGHMQAVIVFYGWLFWMMPNRIVRWMVPLIFVGEGWAMIHCGYHTLSHELAAAGFGLLTLVVYQQGLLKFPSFKMGWVLVGLSLPMILFLLIYHTVAPAVWMSLYALTGCLLAWVFFKKETDASIKALGFREKAMMAVIVFLSVLGMTILFELPYFKQFPPYLGQVYWVVVGSLLPSGMELVRLLSSKKKPNRV